MANEGGAKKHRWIPLALGAAGLATGLVIGGARAVKEIEISSEWEIDAPAEQVFEMLLDTRNYAEWWPEIAGHANTAGPFITARTVARCAARVPVSFLPFLPALHMTLHFPQIERNQRIRARLTGDVSGIAEWVIVPHGAGVVLKNNTRLRLTHPLLNLAALVLPEASWRLNLERMLLEARVGLRRTLEFPEAELALARP
ncbi:MAG TPA: SRPBCC family protein [Ktedonobacterales bacterium]|nr:SRPBCC family protein [Ktedonobacterales bacterium]